MNSFLNRSCLYHEIHPLPTRARQFIVAITSRLLFSWGPIIVVTIAIAFPPSLQASINLPNYCSREIVLLEVAVGNETRYC